MKSVDIKIAGLPYSLACEEGQEGHVSQLAAEIDQRAKRIKLHVPRASEPMVLVMTALMLADELYEAREEAGMLHEKLALGMNGSGNASPHEANGQGEISRPSLPDEPAPAASSAVSENLAGAMHDLAEQLELIAASVERRAG